MLHNPNTSQCWDKRGLCVVLPLSSTRSTPPVGSVVSGDCIGLGNIWYSLPPGLGPQTPACCPESGNNRAAEDRRRLQREHHQRNLTDVNDNNEMGRRRRTPMISKIYQSLVNVNRSQKATSDNCSRPPIGTPVQVVVVLIRAQFTWYVLIQRHDQRLAVSEKKIHPCFSFEARQLGEDVGIGVPRRSQRCPSLDRGGGGGGGGGRPDMSGVRSGVSTPLPAPTTPDRSFPLWTCPGQVAVN